MISANATTGSTFPPGAWNAPSGRLNFFLATRRDTILILIVIAANNAPKLTIVEVNCGKHAITTHGIVTNTAALNGTPALLFFANPSGISPLSAAAWIALDVRDITVSIVVNSASNAATEISLDTHGIDASFVNAAAYNGINCIPGLSIKNCADTIPTVARIIPRYKQSTMIIAISTDFGTFLFGFLTSDTMNAIATIEPYPVIAVGTIARNPVLPPEPCVKNGTNVEPSQAPLTNAIITYAIIVSARPNTNKLLTLPARANFMLLRTRRSVEVGIGTG